MSQEQSFEDWARTAIAAQDLLLRALYKKIAENHADPTGFLDQIAEDTEVSLSAKIEQGLQDEAMLREVIEYVDGFCDNVKLRFE